MVQVLILMNLRKFLSHSIVWMKHELERLVVQVWDWRLYLMLLKNIRVKFGRKKAQWVDLLSLYNCHYGSVTKNPKCGKFFTALFVYALSTAKEITSLIFSQPKATIIRRSTPSATPDEFGKPASNAARKRSSISRTGNPCFFLC